MPKKPKRRNSKETSRVIQPASAASKPFEFNPDYSFVVRDLRTIGILAGTFVTILIILSFFLN
jgi:hypothetical protein